MKTTISVRGFTPQIASDVFVADNARIMGDVKIGLESSVWYNVTIRGDVMPIRIGNEVNIQDGSVLHGTYGKFGCTVHDRVTIGHLVMLHGCIIGRESLIGMGSIIMDGAVIGEQSIVGAGSLVTENSNFPPRSLIIGRPAKAKRTLTEEEVKALSYSADNYLLYKTWYELEEKR
ncbi:MAG TPA: gamma carbonic anhydrase family protein [Pseudobdellovibrionaceae bacterium]|jgi:carbonic anhydrase/acetyltransferase-like protein (isoleucine patch superfamily)